MRLFYWFFNWNSHDQHYPRPYFNPDFGSQYSQLIARRVREAGVYSEMYAFDMSDEDIRAFNPKGIILSGGPESVHQEGSPRAPKAVFELGVPVLGVCYGFQTMAEQLGGKVEAGDVHEFGYAKIDIVQNDKLLNDIADANNQSQVWMSHGDKVSRLPEGFVTTSSTPSCPYASASDEARGFYGVQFHPEVTHTEKGVEFISNFVHGICGCGNAWNSENIIEMRIAQLKEQIGDEKYY